MKNFTRFRFVYTIILGQVREGNVHSSFNDDELIARENIFGAFVVLN